MRLPLRSEISDEQQLHVYLHDMQELHGFQSTPSRIKYLRQFDLVAEIVRGLDPTQVLDVGCAQGNLAIRLLENGINVVACDLRRQYLSYARMKNDSARGDFVVADAYRLPFRSQAFDVVFAGELIEHLAFPQELLLECWRALHPDGHLVLTTPNGRNVFSRLPTFREIDDWSTLSTSQCGSDADDHLFLFTPRELSDLLKGTNFIIEEALFLKSSIINNRMEPLFVRTPLRLSLRLDKLLSALPGFRQWFSEGLIIVAKRLSRDACDA